MVEFSGDGRPCCRGRSSSELSTIECELDLGHSSLQEPHYMDCNSHIQGLHKDLGGRRPANSLNCIVTCRLEVWFHSGVRRQHHVSSIECSLCWNCSISFAPAFLQTASLQRICREPRRRHGTNLGRYTCRTADGRLDFGPETRTATAYDVISIRRSAPIPSPGFTLHYPQFGCPCRADHCKHYPRGGGSIHPCSRHSLLSPSSS